ncbi:hypothetical protein GCM10023147_21320 [Tsukamurella soli]|uniref:Uncharacterized protein n=1 Tax=Tsukamurella soli TaxID=644556 RepID=A0ABP8JJP6_9ACTN
MHESGTERCAADPGRVRRRASAVDAVHATVDDVIALALQYLDLVPIVEVSPPRIWASTWSASLRQAAGLASSEKRIMLT